MNNELNTDRSGLQPTLPSKKMMKHARQPTPPEPFGIHDILCVLYKKRWTILAFTLVGLSASALVYTNREILYQSQVKLLVRYVLNRNNIDAFQSQLSPTGAGGDHVINTEIEILTSGDLALAVVEKLGLEQVIPDAPPSASSADAAGTILSSLDVGAVPGNVIHIHYRSPDPDRTVNILSELVTQYAVKHLEIHRSAAAFEVVAQEASLVQERLRKTEKELNQLRTSSGITTLAEATGALATQRAKTLENLMAAKALQEEQRARIKALGPAKISQPITTEIKGIQPGNDDPAQLPPSITTEYRTILDMLDVLQKRSIDLRLKFKPGNTLVQSNQRQLIEHEMKRAAMLERYPELASQPTSSENNEMRNLKDSLVDEAALSSISARVAAFQNHLKEIKEQFNEQYAIGAKIEELERQRQMQDAEYRSLEQSLKDAKVDQTLDPSRMPNITVVQQASKPVQTYDKKTHKFVLGLAASGFVIGIGFAFLTELLLDRRIKRPTEIQNRLKIPLMMTIPRIGIKDKSGHALAEPINKISEFSEITPSSHLMPRTAERRAHFILPFTETIRDRIIFNFELNRIIHKPKLIAVTGLTPGAGASTIAAGLAKSFSEISGAKVLLVDLSSCRPEDNPVFGKIARHSLHGAMQLAKHQNFKSASQNLYFAGANARRGTDGFPTFSPLHLYEVLPHLRASSYDYVIFDMPPMDQTSRTLAMAGLMDKVLLILDANRISRDNLQWAYDELSNGNADVSCVFNKANNDAPNWLLGNS
jgi:uncharacterized protein involved in exopolysaccharide biosynthesis/Mrp family chromosome partitioning ATPase